MQTKLRDEFKNTTQGQEADQILRQCVHCGMCNATCPTYQLLGNELDGPRGRIYLIKQVLEGHEPSHKTQLHLDRCLTCRSCETTCPSGVRYGRLLEIGREVVEKKVGRSWSQAMLRSALKNGISRPRVFQHALIWGRTFKAVLPKKLREKIPAVAPIEQGPQSVHAHKVILLEGCVQASLAPHINVATAQVLDRLQIQSMIVPEAACCGAVSLHLGDQEGAKKAARQNIDAWWSLVGPDADPGKRVAQIVMTASGCGVTVKEYGDLLAHDAQYVEKARAISALTCDLSELLAGLSTTLVGLIGQADAPALVWHAPCSLQHGQQIRGKVEGLLQSLGVDVRVCADSHLCCGSAGTYSLLQADLARQLRDLKLQALEATQADVIISANMACQQHLQTGTKLPVKHWIEVLAALLAQRPMASVEAPVGHQLLSATPKQLASQVPASAAGNDIETNHIESLQAKQSKKKRSKKSATTKTAMNSQSKGGKAKK
jgi:glycolate oxidase iron-sulfur subunit